MALETHFKIVMGGISRPHSCKARLMHEPHAYHVAAQCRIKRKYDAILSQILRRSSGFIMQVLRIIPDQTVFLVLQIFREAWYAESVEIVLGHTSSMEFWRTKRSHSQTRTLLARRCEPQDFRSGSYDEAKPSVDALDRIERIGLKQHSNPVHLIVPNVSSRVRTARITCSVFDKRIPQSAFVHAGDGVFVAAPELCLLLEARTAAFANLVETGYEFCGNYRLPTLMNGDMTPDQPPLTSIPKISAFLSRAQNISGISTARKAVSHILPNSESPKESQLSIVSCFPGRLGGYGFPQAALNYPIRISEKARGRNVSRICRCDLYWPEAKLDVEYDSRLHHAGEAEQVKDSARRTALAYAGILVITVTSEQLHTRSEMDKVAHAMAKRMGRRCRCRARDWELRRIKLRSQLFGTSRNEIVDANQHL